ncbi:MAG: rod shape-determining protein MreC [Candidatus Moraniibacteriota bacterium]
MKDQFKNNANYIVAFVLIVILLFLFLNNSQKKPLQATVQFLSAPFAGFFSKSGYWFEEKVDFFSSIGELKEENQELYKENLHLKSELAKLKDVENENDKLRSQIELAPRDDYDLEAATVLGRDLINGKEALYLNKGKKSGIEKDMPLIVNEGVLIGRVAKVFSGSCEVELILNKEGQINAEIVESETKGIVHGEYGTSVVMDMIPQSVEIESDQTVITSGLGGTYPRGLLIGYTKDSITTSDQLFQKVSLNLPVEIDNTRIAWIVKEVKYLD